MSRHHDAIKNDRRWKQAKRQCHDRDGWRCVQCGDENEIEADHIVALADGGAPFELDNLQTLCGPCNRNKGDRVSIRQPWFNSKWLTHL